jgi:preprotein translocase subunit SecF
MFPLRIVPAETAIDFLRRRLVFFLFSGALIISSIGLFLTVGLSYGIDFKGGIMIEVRDTRGAADIGGMREELGALGLGEVSLQEFGEPSDVLIRIQQQEGGESAQNEAVLLVKSTLGEGYEYRRTEFVGPKVSDELFWDGLMAIGLALGGILIYIWFRFEWQFGIGAIVALTHDVVSTVGVFALIQHEFNLATVAAVLTIAGYSINDTVVVFDRVRENMRRYKTMPFDELLNLSINGTLSRTALTSVTTLLALISLYLFGGEIIRDFAFAMIWGVVIGTYSSVCVAVPVLLYLNVRRDGFSDDDEELDDAAIARANLGNSES